MTNVGQAGRLKANARTAAQRRKAARKARVTRASRIRAMVRTWDGRIIWADVPRDHPGILPT